MAMKVVGATKIGCPFDLTTTPYWFLYVSSSANHKLSIVYLLYGLMTNHMNQFYGAFPPVWCHFVALQPQSPFISII